MTNAVHQTIASNTTALAASMPKGTNRLRQRSVRLYSPNNEPLFYWSGMARTPFDAVALARSKYSEALEAIFRAQGLSRADASADLSVAESEVLKAASPNAWRVTSRATWEAESHRKARRVFLGAPLANNIAQCVAMSDRDCIAALQHDHTLTLGMWLSAVGKDRLIDIDSCWLVSTPAGTVRVPHSNGVLRDVLRCSPSGRFRHVVRSATLRATLSMATVS
jgi:hypothetical protein